jgi:predicted AAA+ superfamily ATPase
MPTFDRSVVAAVRAGLGLTSPLLQILIGPRQVGKTTAARRVADGWTGPVHYATADLPLPPGPEWIESHWQLARRDTGRAPLLVLDEVQKVRGWSETVKALWDDDRAQRRDLRVLLLGSSALLLAEGSSESLAGRFLLHRCLHWSWRECRTAFGWELDTWIFFGGYPGAAVLIEDEEVWRRYVTDSLVETVLARDVLALERITKPTLLRHLFALVARFPAQILSYNKMLGQLQDAGNTTTLADYLRLCERAFLVTGLERFSAGEARSRGSSPKVVLWNDALVTALGMRSFAEARRDSA